MRKSLRLLFITVTMLCLCITVPWQKGYAVAFDESVQPAYVLTGATKVSLSISEAGIAQCSSYIRSANPTDTVSITVTLCRKEGSNWISVKSWSEREHLYYASVNETYSVSSGTYRLQMSGTVAAADGTIERVYGTSAEKILN